MINIKTPKGWRKGQTLFNFLEWLAITKGYSPDTQQRTVDPFHFSDNELDKLFDEFISDYSGRIK